MAYNPTNPNGQNTMSNSSPVVIASDQSNLPVSLNSLTYPISTNNATIVQLASGVTWIGTLETIVNQQAAQVSITCDQPYSIWIEQYRDAGATELVSRDILYKAANEPTNENITLPGDFFRLVIKNLGPVITTTFKVSTTFGIMNTLPRTLGTNPNIGTDQALPTRLVPQTILRTTFAKVLGSTWDTDFWTRIILGSGMANNQSAGNGVITTGTTINQETILRSKKAFVGSFLLREQTILSQRIANNSFYVELVDIIGDNLVITVNSATSVTVTIPNNPFTSENVGQSMYIGALTGFTGVTSVPNRYAIASIAGNDVTFTVAGWATGSVNTGTCSLFGWNYHQLLYDSTTATQAKYDTQRKGWNSGFTTATVSTTATGHMAIMGAEDGNAFLSDQLVASTTGIPIVTRASRVINIAEETTPLFLQIRAVNGTTNPASTTTWTIGAISVENYASQQVTIANSKVQGANTGTSVKVESLPTLATVTTVTTVGTVTTLANGQTAHSAAATGSPLRIGGKVAPTTIATQDVTLVAGDASDAFVSSAGQLITKEGATAELGFNIPVSSVGTTVTVQGLVPSPAQASVRNYIKTIRVANDTLGAAGNLWILDSIVSVTSIAITTGLATTGTHDLRVGDPIVFTALAAGTGVTENQIYYVTTVGSATTFNFSATPGGSNVVPSVAYTGTSMYRVLDQIRLQTTAGERSFTYDQPIRNIANTITNFLIPVSLTSGNIYITVNGYRGF